MVEDIFMPQADQLVAIVTGALGAVSAAGGTMIAVLNYRQQRVRETQPQDHEHQLSQAATQLANAVRRQWREEEDHRRINDPFPLPVHWVNGPDQLTDHWSNILLQGPGAKSAPLDLSGSLEHVNEIFDKVPSKRVVVLGKAGSGKTILTVRYILGALNQLKSNASVPVILGLASWDPGKMSAREWLIYKLIDEYPGLARSMSDGSSVAAGLVDSGRIFPVLDGFDEMANELRSPALISLNATTFPLVLTSRPDEYQAAVNTANVLSAAAIVSLADLTIDDLADYLPRTARKLSQGRQIVTKWDPVLTYMRRHPNTSESRTARAVMSTPLMVGLARAIYSDTKDGDPSELIDSSRFSTAEMLEDHLLDAFIPAVYQHRTELSHGRMQRDFSPENSLQWLSNIAVDLAEINSRDLAWWKLRDTVSLRARMIVCALISTVGAGLLLGVIWKFGVGLGLGFGVGIALVKVGRPPIRVQPRIRGREREFATTVFGGIVGGILGALAGGAILKLTHSTQGLILGPLARSTSGSAFNSAATIVIGIVTGVALSTISWAGIQRMTPGATHKGRIPESLAGSATACALCIVGGIIGSVALGFTGGLTLGIAFGVSGGPIIGLEAPLDIKTAASSFDLLRTDRRNSLSSGVLLGLTLGLAVLIATWPVIGPPKALALALGCCFMQVIAISLAFTAWGHWIIFARGWLPISGHLPFALYDFIIDSYQRGVLRQAGAVYQFRHARLQDRLVARQKGSSLRCP